MVNNAKFVFAKDALTRKIIFGFLNISTKVRIKYICDNKCNKQILLKNSINKFLKRVHSDYHMYLSCIGPNPNFASFGVSGNLYFMFESIKNCEKYSSPEDFMLKNNIRLDLM